MDSLHLSRFEYLLHRWAGQWFPDSRRGELERALIRACEKFGFESDVNSFLLHMEDNPTEEERQSVIQEVLVGETYFFRDASLWDGLREEILVSLIREKFARRHLKFWSCGCSTGEEPYSIALYLQQYLPRLETWDIQILATDISEPSLAKAQTGIYGRRALRELDRKRWQKWFDYYDNGVQIKSEIRNMVHFVQHNLNSLDFPNLQTGNTDIIFCRNVLIYLDRDLVNQIICRFRDCLAPQGWLILAPTEVPLDPPPGLRIEQLKSGLMTLRPVENKSEDQDTVNVFSKFGNGVTGSGAISEATLGSRLQDFHFISGNLPLTPQPPLISPTPVSLDNVVAKLVGMERIATSQFQESVSPQPETAQAYGALSASAPPATSGLEGLALDFSHQALHLPLPKSVAAWSGPDFSHKNAPNRSSAGKPELPSTPLPAAPFEQETESNAKSAGLAKELALQARQKADRGNWSEAIIDAMKSVDQDPSITSTWLVLALIQEEMERFTEALESLNKAVYLEPQLAVAYLQIARIKARLGDPSLSRSIAYFNKLTRSLMPDEVLPESSGLLVRDARSLAYSIEHSLSRQRGLR